MPSVRDLDAYAYGGKSKEERRTEPKEEEEEEEFEPFPAEKVVVIDDAIEAAPAVEEAEEVVSEGEAIRSALLPLERKY